MQPDGGIATNKASPSPSAWAHGFYLFVLGSPLLAVLRYSLETHRLVQKWVEGEPPPEVLPLR